MGDLKVGDRVKVTHRPEHDSKVNASDRTVRRRLDGCMGVVSAPMLGGRMVSAEGCCTWFASDELEPETLTGAALPPIGAKVRPKGGLHAGRVLEVMQHRGGEMLAEKGPWVGWYGPDAVEVLSRVAAAWDAYRTTSPLDTEACAKGLDRALAGVPAPVAPEEPTGLTPDDARAMARLFFAERDQEDGDEDALTGLLMRVSRGEKWTDRPVEAAAREEEPRIAWRGSPSDFVTDMRAVIPAGKWPMLYACLGVTPWGHEAAPEEPREYLCELTVNFGEWRGLARRLPTPAGEPRRWRLEVPIASAEDWREKTHAIGSGIGRDRLAATIGGWVGRVVVNERRPLREGRVMELDVLEWSEPRECQVEIPRPAVPLGDAADLAALIAKVEAHPLHNRGGVVSSALLVDVLRAVERRLVAVERRRPRVGPWTSSGMLHDAAGGTVASVWPCPGGWGWVANRPNLGPLNGTAETEDEAKAAVLAVLSSWCDVVDAPEPREP